MDSGLFGFFNLNFILRLKSLHIFGILLRAFGTEKSWMQVSDCFKDATINQLI